MPISWVMGHLLLRYRHVCEGPLFHDFKVSRPGFDHLELWNYHGRFFSAPFWSASKNLEV